MVCYKFSENSSALHKIRYFKWRTCNGHYFLPPSLSILAWSTKPMTTFLIILFVNMYSVWVGGKGRALINPTILTNCWALSQIGSLIGRDLISGHSMQGSRHSFAPHGPRQEDHLPSGHLVQLLRIRLHSWAGLLNQFLSCQLGFLEELIQINML